MFTYRDRLPDRADHGGDETSRPGPRATGRAARFGALPFRQLAGPAGLFFLWPLRSQARTGTSPGRQP